MNEAMTLEQPHESLIQPAHGVVAIYADGGVVGANPSPVGGVWAWCAVNEHDERVVRRSGFTLRRGVREVTNNNMELVALVLAVEALHEGWSGIICSDSRLALGTLFEGFNARKQPPNIVKRGMAAAARLSKVETMLLQGHPTKEDLITGIGARRNLPVSQHNVWCDQECNRVKKQQKQAFELAASMALCRQLNDCAA